MVTNENTSVLSIPIMAKVILRNNQRGRLAEKIYEGCMAVITLDNGTTLYTDPADIEAYIGENGWVDVIPCLSTPYSM